MNITLTVSSRFISSHLKKLYGDFFDKQ